MKNLIKIDTKEHVIISHTDLDGWVSAYLVEMFLKKNGITDIEHFSYNYGGSYIHIEAAITPRTTIWVVDCTLQHEFMVKYAKQIMWFDHHFSSIDRYKNTTVPFKGNFSSLTLKGYRDIKGNQAEQVAGCELVWRYLFHPTQIDMPSVVFYAGRYDVFDNNDTSLALNAYVYTKLPERGPEKTFRFKQDWFIDLFDEDKFDIAIEEGKKIQEISYIQDARTTASFADERIAFGKCVAIINHTKSNSLLFSHYLKSRPHIDFLVIFKYNFWENIWVVSCYQARGGDALKFLNNFKEHIKMRSIGGHKGACGCSFNTEDISTFLKFFLKRY